MKYLKFFFLAVIMMLGAVACKPEGTDSTDVEYKISPKSLDFPKEGNTLSLNVQTTADVKAVSNSSWCTVEKAQSQSATMTKFTVTVPANDANEARSAAISLTIGSGINETVSVTQAGNPLYIENTEVMLDYNAQEFVINLSASDDYSVDIDGSWIGLVSKTEKAATFSADQNNLPYDREGRIIFSVSKVRYEVVVSQTGFSGEAPAPDKTGMESDAKTLMKKMHLGINLGNTLEAIGGETAWGAPRTTEAIIRYFKELGFNAVRIPCSWNQNLEAGEGYIVKSSWMNRVKEVVDYVVDNDMYAVLNIHWDEGWLENDIPNGYDEAVDAQQRSIWTQIATAFRDYDEHLVFAGTNEPNVEDADDMAVLLRYEQTFIDAVRATGGKNAYRVLVFQGPSTDVDRTVELMHQLPEDKVEGRLAAEVHYYTPYQFCGLGQDEWWGKMQFFWGEETKDYAVGAYIDRWVSDYGNEEYLAGQMEKMKTKFWDNGIPVIIGEFGAISDRKMDLGTPEENLKAEEGYRKSLALYNGGVVREAKAHGCVPFFWHCEDDMIDRSGLKVTDQARLDAIIEAGNTQYPD